MKNILIIGAGRSATALIDYTLRKAETRDWFITLVDADAELANRKLKGHPKGRAAGLDILQVDARREQIAGADIVVSLLPAHLHFQVAEDCILLNKHLITASYVSQELYRLGDEARSRGLIFMGEMGLDPGIDHMSAMQTIDAIKDEGGTLTSFRSYTGGLIAPESDTNPWHYKFTWNPRNVVLSGQGTAQYLEDGKFKYIPYTRLFKEHRQINIPGMGTYEVYANRDSLLYRDVYGLKNIPNILRGTIRHQGFCDAWNALVKIGLTDNSYPILESNKLSYRAWMEAYVRPSSKGSVQARIAELIGEPVEGPVMQKLEWIGLFSEQAIELVDATPALILEHLLLQKWKLEPGDLDMILMQHQFEYEREGERRQRISSLVMKGDDDVNTAMAKLVGLPLGIFVRLVLEGKINQTGVNIPVMPQVYTPVLEELKEYGVAFTEQDHPLPTPPKA